MNSDIVSTKLDKAGERMRELEVKWAKNFWELSMAERQK